MICGFPQRRSCMHAPTKNNGLGLSMLVFLALACKTTSEEPPVTQKPQPEGHTQSTLGMPMNSCSGKNLNLSLAGESSPFAAKKNEIDALSDQAVREICESKTAVIFIGNADSFGTLEFRAPLAETVKAAIRSEWTETASQFSHAVRKASSELDNMFNNSCRSIYERRKLPTKELQANNQLAFIQILDGPEVGDSMIATRVYGWSANSWTSERKLWKYDQGLNGLTPCEMPCAQELNMPRDAQSIAEALLAKIAPPQGFDQHIYIFKTHGGLYTNSAASLTSPLLDRSTSSTENHSVLLFDTHGPGGPLNSDLAAPFWSRASACRVLNTLRPKMARELGCQETLNLGETAGVDGSTCNTASTGKGQLIPLNSDLLRNPILDPSEVARCMGPGCSDLLMRAAYSPEGFIALGEAATYDPTLALPRGVHRLKLSAISSNKPFASSTILLDSCFGMDHVIDSLAQTAHQRLITVTSANPLYFNLVNYENMSAVDFFRLPYLLGFDPGIASIFPFGTAYDELLQTFHDGSLCGCQCQKNPSPSCKAEPKFSDCSACTLDIRTRKRP